MPSEGRPLRAPQSHLSSSPVIVLRAPPLARALARGLYAPTVASEEAQGAAYDNTFTICVRPAGI